MVMWTAVLAVTILSHFIAGDNTTVVSYRVTFLVSSPGLDEVSYI